MAEFRVRRTVLVLVSVIETSTGRLKTSGPTGANWYTVPSFHRIFTVPSCRLVITAPRRDGMVVLINVPSVWRTNGNWLPSGRTKLNDASVFGERVVSWYP